MQSSLFLTPSLRRVEPFKKQLLKWVGNKQRFAHEIASWFPESFGTYFEPFLGSGAVMGTLAPTVALGADAFLPLVEIWQTLQSRPEQLMHWYSERWVRMKEGDKREVYEEIRASYNAYPNPADLLFLSRSCYGGVVRFRQVDGFMSTPCGAHSPISPHSFAERVAEWVRRTSGATFLHADYREIFDLARPGDLIYCDPPYSDSQSILYGAQSFRLSDLVSRIADAKDRGVYVALSIDGYKRSGKRVIDLGIPEGVFLRELFVSTGRSMLKRFQMDGRSLEDEVVADRLLLTY